MLKKMLTFAALAGGSALLAQQFLKSRGSAGGTKVRESIEVDLPVRAVYDQWTQFEEFPQFMEGVHAVQQLDDKRLHWKADVLGKPLEWDAEITQQIPDKKIAWRSTSGTRNDGVVTFSPLSEARTRVTLEMQYEPGGAVESVGDALGAVRMHVRQSLTRFKETLEARGKETGAWRGAINPQAGSQQPH